jgi:hypothetical protein
VQQIPLSGCVISKCDMTIKAQANFDPLSKSK